jgi:hypothetical protein
VIAEIGFAGPNLSKSNIKKKIIEMTDGRSAGFDSRIIKRRFIALLTT